VNDFARCLTTEALSEQRVRFLVNSISTQLANPTDLELMLLEMDFQTMELKRFKFPSPILQYDAGITIRSHRNTLFNSLNVPTLNLRGVIKQSYAFIAGTRLNPSTGANIGYTLRLPFTQFTAQASQTLTLVKMTASST